MNCQRKTRVPPEKRCIVCMALVLGIDGSTAPSGEQTSRDFPCVRETP